MEDAFGAFACISANALLFTSNTLQQLPLAAYRVAYEKHDDTLRVTFIPPHSLPTSYLVPLVCSIMTFELATNPSPIPSVQPAYQTPRSHYLSCLILQGWRTSISLGRAAESSDPPPSPIPLPLLTLTRRPTTAQSRL